MSKERWYMYGRDAQLALTLLRQELALAPNSAARANLLRLLPNLGQFSEAEAWLLGRDPQLRLQLSGRATLLRVWQQLGHSNPWLALLNPGQAEPFLQFCELLHREQHPIQIWLGGGLGDQLEAIGILSASLPRDQITLMLPKSSQPALEPLLQLAQAGIPAWRFSDGSPNSDQRWLSLIPSRAYLVATGQEQPLQPWLKHQRKSPTARQPWLVCCWRSKVDPDERLWSHLRSLDIGAIHSLYRRLLPTWTQEGLRVIDITAYNPWERHLLQERYPQLELIQPNLRSLADTAHYVGGALGVVSVDTALVHLARLLTTPVLLLLHQHPDSRWHELSLTGGLERERIGVVRQTSYNSWSGALSALQRQSAQWLHTLTT